MAFQETVVVDARTICNRNPFFFPIARPLQSDFQASEIRSDVIPGWLNSIGGVLPGERMTVDFKNLTARVVQKLSLPEFKEVGKKVKAVAATEAGGLQSFTSWGEPEEHRFGPTEVATWLYHLRVLVDAGKLHVVSGKLPEMSEIRRMGMRIQTGDNWGISAKVGNQYGLKDINFIEPIEDSKQLVGAGK